MNGDLACNMAVLEGCPSTNGEEHFKSRPFSRDDALPCEFELPTAGDVEWLLFSYT